MVNKVILIGRLGRDPEIRRLENGAVVAKFSVATNESYKDSSGQWQDNTEWHDVIAWRVLAEKAERTLKKGSVVYVEGKLTHRTWQDKDNNTRKTTEVVANYLRSMSGREEGTSGGGNSLPSAEDEPPYSATSYRPVVEEVTDTADDDLPF